MYENADSSGRVVMPCPEEEQVSYPTNKLTSMVHHRESQADNGEQLPAVVLPPTNQLQNSHKSSVFSDGRRTRSVEWLGKWLELKSMLTSLDHPDQDPDDLLPMPSPQPEPKEPHEDHNYQDHQSYQQQEPQQSENSEGSVLLIDCRSHNEYKSCHVRGALLISVPSLVLRRLKKGNVGLGSVLPRGDIEFRSKYNGCSIVLYDDSNEGEEDRRGPIAEEGEMEPSRQNTVTVTSVMAQKLFDGGYDAFILRGGFSSFRQQFPHLCVSCGDENGSTAVEATEFPNDPSIAATILGLQNLHIVAPTPPKTYSTREISGGARSAPTSAEDCRDLSQAPTPHIASNFPAEVLPYLFVGNASNSGDRECLKRHNISHIVNVTANVPNSFEKDGDFKYLQIPIDDHWSQNLSSFFPKAIAFIDEARDNKTGVLVHCLAGVSRSVTVTVAYLMTTLSLTMNDAYDHVKRCKPNISPNFNFMGQLLDFERALRHRSVAYSSSCSSSSSGCCPSCSVDALKPLAACLCSSCPYHNNDTKIYFSSPVPSCTSSLSSLTSSSSPSSFTSASASASAAPLKFEYNFSLT